MRKTLWLFSVAVIFTLVYTACDTIDLTPAPEVEIARFQPYGAYVSVATDTVVLDSIVFRVLNYVDGIVREMDVEYRSVNSGNIVASNYRAGFGIQLSGGDEWCEGSQYTTVVGWYIDVGEAVTHMFANNDNAVAEITFRGEDAFGNEREFDCSMYFALIQMPEVLSQNEKHKVIPIIE